MLDVCWLPPVSLPDGMTTKRSDPKDCGSALKPRKTWTVKGQPQNCVQAMKAAPSIAFVAPTGKMHMTR